MIDHSKNDIDDETINHIPTLRLFPKGKQNAALHKEIDTPPHKHITSFQIWLKKNSVVYASAFTDEHINPSVLNSDEEDDPANEAQDSGMNFIDDL